MVQNMNTSTRLILAIFDHYLAISKVLDSISRRIPTIDLTEHNDLRAEYSVDLKFDNLKTGILPDPVLYVAVS